MSIRYIFASAFFVVALKASLLAQSAPHQTVVFHAPVERIPMTIQTGVNHIRIEGLSKGDIYSIIAVGAYAEQQNELKTSLADADQEAEAKMRTPESRPAWRQFQANSNAVELVLEASGEAYASGIPIFLSIGCESCERDHTWEQKFNDKVESILAVIQVTPGISALSLVTNTLVGGDCFDVSGITSSGNTNSRGTFTNGATNIGLATGVVLSSGHVNITPGPNNSQNANNGFNNNSPDDPDLATLTTGNQWDVSKIEFDFTPTAATVQFDFVFASEEYCEYVGTQFNDVFGFFISGPGITGNQNLAVIPSTTTPITINDVNHITNAQYYVNNNTWNPCQAVPAAAINDIQYDGFTTVLTATANVEPCETYHIKLAIADVADQQYASAVFLLANSFNAGGTIKLQPIYPNGQTFIYEDCGPGGFIRFFRAGGDLSQPFSVDYTLDPSSTATPGLDYNALPNPVIIPAGASYVDIPVTALPDLLIEGNESIILSLTNSCSCSSQTIEYIIADKPPLEVTLDDQMLCGGTSVTLAPSLDGGLAPYTYNWSNGSSAASITVNAQGVNTYTVTVTDHCGTTATAQATVTIEPQPTANITGSGVFCAGASPTPIDLTMTFTGTGPWTVEYNAAGNTVTETYTTSPVVIQATEPGAYNLISVSSASGCTGTVTGNVNLTEITVNVTLTPTDPGCAGASNGSIQGSASGGTAPFNFVWSTGAMTPNLSNVPVGTYMVTVTNANGCTAVESVDLNEPPPLTASATASNIIDCNNPSGNPELDVSGGTPGYNYNWSNGSNQQSPNITMGGTYTVTVTDTHGCTTTTNVVFTANLTLPTAAANFMGQITCVNTFVEINGLGSSQGPNFTYEWSGPSFLCCETTLLPQVDQGGTYTLTVTNTDNGCTKTVSVTIPQNTTPPNANINPPGSIGCNTPVLTLNGNGTSTGPGINYTWSTPDGNFTCCTNTLNPQINQAGTYNISVVNTNNGCTAEASVTIGGNTIPPVAAADVPGVVSCYDPEIFLSGNGSSVGSEFTYLWTTTNGNITSGANTLDPTINQGGTYTLVVTNTDNNCTATVTVTVTQNNTPPIAIANVQGAITCQTPTVTINGNGSSTGAPFTYEWTTGDGNIVSGENTLNPVVNQGGTYTLLVTNADNGCTATATANVNADQDIPIADAGPDLLLNCLNPTVQLDGSGIIGSGINIQWTANPGNIVSGGNTPYPVVNQPGLYTLLVTNPSNGCTSEDYVEVTQNLDTPDAVIAPPDLINCYNPEIDLDANGSTQGPDIVFSWTTVNGNIVSNADSPFPTVDQAGTYTLVVTNTASGCTDQAQVTVSQNLTPPISNAGLGFEIDCQHPTATLNANGSSQGGNYTYLWETFDGNIVSGETTLTPVVDEPGRYYLVVTNVVNGCTAQDYVDVTIDQNYPNAAAGPDLVLNCANATLQLEGIYSSSGNGYTSQWVASPGNIVSGANTLSPVVNESGYYLLTITNTQNGCTDTDEVYVDENFIHPDVAIATPQQLNCNWQTVQLDASGSSQGNEIEYNWTTNNGNILYGQTTPYPEVDEPGTYTLVLSNVDNFCTATASVLVTLDTTPPIAAAAPQGQLNCQYPFATLTGLGSSVGSEFFYSWSTTNGHIVNGEFTLYPTVNLVGDYTLEVTNIETGCVSTATATVTASQQFPVAAAGLPQTITCGSPQVSLNGTASSQGGQYTYAWTTTNGSIVSGANTLTPLVNAPGNYNLAVVNTQNGCTSYAVVGVGIDTITPTAIAAPGGTLSCTVTTLILNGAGSSVGTDYVYNWTTVNGNILSGQNTLSPVVNAVGNYSLVVTDQSNGCTDIAISSVDADASLPVADAGVTDTLNCYVALTILNGQASSQGIEYTYQWAGPGIVSGQNTLSPQVNASGNYVLLVTNTSNGCTATDAVAITSDVAPPDVEAGPAAVINCYYPTLQLNGNGTSLGAAFAYNWSTSNGNILTGANTLTPLVDQPGSYQLSVLNSNNGCTATDVVVIDQDTNFPQANAGAPGLITCTQAVVTLNATASSGTQFDYLWTSTNGNIANGANTLTPEVDAPGWYVLSVIDSINGCQTIDSVEVTKDVNVPNAIATVTGELNCAVTLLQINGLGSTQGPGVLYSWTTINGNIVAGDSTLTPTVDAPGQYTLLVYNSLNDCLAQFSTNVAQNITLPLANAGLSPTISCQAPVATLNASLSNQGPQYTYNWTTNGGHILSGGNTLMPQVDASGFYTIVVTNTNNGCTSSATVQVLQDQNTPVALAAAPPQLTCAVTSLSLNGAGSSIGAAFSYAWSTANGNIVSGGTSLNPTIDAPGDYTLLVTNSQNGCTQTTQVNVSEDVALPVAAITNPNVLNCQALTVDVDGTGSSSGALFTYQWSSSNGNIVQGANAISAQVDQPGDYVLLVTNTYSGCTNTSTATVVQDVSLPIAEAGPTDQLNCTHIESIINGSVSNAGANYQIAWSTQNGNIVSGGNSFNPIVNQPGNYLMTVTNLLNFCTATDVVAITQDVTLPVAAIANPATITCAVPNVPINGAQSSSGPLFTYAWSTQNGNIVSGANTSIPMVNATGTYVLLVTNTSNHCTSTATVLVPINIVPPAAEAGVAQTLNCVTPSLQLNGSGSSTGNNFTYLWTTSNGNILSGDNTLNPVIDAPGQYQILVTNTQNGCSSTDAVDALIDVNLPLAAAASPDELTCSATSVGLSGIGSSSGAFFTYNWTGPAVLSGTSSLNPTVGSPGLYQILVTNTDNGCTQTANVTVTQNIQAPAADAGAQDLVTCFDPQLNLSGSGTGGINGVGYQWSTNNGNIVSGTNSPNPVVNAGGVYTLTITDLYNGCTATDNVLILSSINPPALAIAQAATLTCAITAVPLSTIGSSTGPQFVYSWTGPGIVSGANTSAPTVNQPGVYNLTILNNDNGCSSTGAVTVPQDVQVPFADAGLGFELNCTVLEDNLNGSASSSGPNFTYFWTGPGIVSGANTIQPIVNVDGAYQILVSNVSNGCTATDVVSVTQNTNYPSAIDLFTELPACGGQPGLIRFEEVTGGVGPYLYSIDGGNQFLSANQFGSLDPGTYDLLVQDINGCEYSESLVFPVPVEPAVTLPPEIELAFGDSQKLIAVLNIPLYDVDTIIWSPMESITLTNLPNEVIVRPFQSTEYEVRIINKDGCEDRATIFVRVDDPAIWAPNAISPLNQDGFNDVFLLFAKEKNVKIIHTLQIYDRWGNLVFLNQEFEPNQPKYGWDGSFNGQAMNPAVFVWWAEVELVSGETILMKGDVTVVR